MTSTPSLTSPNVPTTDDVARAEHATHARDAVIHPLAVTPPPTAQRPRRGRLQEAASDEATTGVEAPSDGQPGGQDVPDASADVDARALAPQGGEQVALAASAGGDVGGVASSEGGVLPAMGATAEPTTSTGIVSTPAMLGLGGLLVAGLAVAGGGGGGSKGTDSAVKPPVDGPAEPSQPVEPQNPDSQAPGTSGGQTPAEPDGGTTPQTPGTGSSGGAGTEVPDAGTGDAGGEQTPAVPGGSAEPETPATDGDPGAAEPGTPTDPAVPPPSEPQPEPEPTLVAPQLSVHKTGTVDGQTNKPELHAENFEGDFLRVTLQMPDGTTVEKTSRDGVIQLDGGDGRYTVVSAEYGFDDASKGVGVVSHPSQTFVVDTLAPQEITFFSGAGQSLGADLDIWKLFGLESSSTWKYQVNSGEWMDGSQDTIDMRELPNDSFRLNFRQEDGAGNFVESSFVVGQFISYWGDAGLPRVVIQDTGGLDDGYDLFTNNKSLIVRGELSADGLLYLSSTSVGIPWNGEGEVSGFIFVPDDGMGYVVNVTSDTVVGQHGFRVGYASRDYAINVFVDSEAPTAVTLHWDQSQHIEVRGIEEQKAPLRTYEATWRYQLDNGDWLAGTGQSIDVSGLTGGTHVVRVVQEDRAGNVSEVSELSFDTTLATTALALPHTDGSVI